MREEEFEAEKLSFFISPICFEFIFVLMSRRMKLNPLTVDAGFQVHQHPARC
jgi:hypothetical protein